MKAIIANYTHAISILASNVKMVSNSLTKVYVLSKMIIQKLTLIAHKSQISVLINVQNNMVNVIVTAKYIKDQVVSK